MLIVVTLGFTIAFTWRQSIFDVSQEAIQFFINTTSSTFLSFATSLFITITSIFLIFLTAHLLKETPDTE